VIEKVSCSAVRALIKVELGREMAEQRKKESIKRKKEKSINKNIINGEITPFLWERESVGKF
jgi:hypothetical protein